MAYHYRRKEKVRRKKKRLFKVILGVDVLLVIVLLCVAFSIKEKKTEEADARAKAEAAREETAKQAYGIQQDTENGAEEEETEIPETDKTDDEKEKLQDSSVSITVSAVGDCTLGTDENFAWEDSLPAKYEEQGDPSYFFRNVQPIFAADDLTIVNFEGTLTTSDAREDKQFAFKADSSYAQILTTGSVEAANLANNHSRDYGEQSYTDTIDALEESGIVTFGYERISVMDVKGVKVGLLGTYVLAEGLGIKDSMIQNINSLKEQGAQIIIASFHWGSEKAYEPDETQIELAHAAIDNGADLVLGHHPHVLEKIEEYNGKNIVYSLGNFCFGGNSYPSDMDTIIFQQTFTVENGILKEDNVKNIIPCKISSADGYNNYQPTPAEEWQKEDILAKIRED